MRIYLDMCSLQRPLDDPSQLRVRLEAEAIFTIIRACDSRRAALVSSVALEYENRRSPRPDRQDHVYRLLARAVETIPLSSSVERLAATFNGLGLKTLDSLHLACAVAANVEFFCTCDDRFLKRGRTIDTGNSRVVSPLELVTELGL